MGFFRETAVIFDLDGRPANDARRPRDQHVLPPAVGKRGELRLEELRRHAEYSMLKLIPRLLMSLLLLLAARK